MHEPACALMDKEAGREQGHRQADQRSRNQLLGRKAPGEQDPEGKAQHKGGRHGGKSCFLQTYLPFI